MDKMVSTILFRWAVSFEQENSMFQSLPNLYPILMTVFVWISNLYTSLHNVANTNKPQGIRP